ncbi:MAG: PTS sugar transporter subunit IIA [Thiohalocapsa sp.]|jgi:PTS system nitrogen regulatory IIA component
MLPPDLITETRIVCRSEVASKKRLLESLGELLADDIGGLTREAAFEHLLERERLGSTGLGKGVALPHARMVEVEAPVGAFIQLRSSIEFDAIDDAPVDLALALLVPDKAHEHYLSLLAELAEQFSNAALRQRLRAAQTPSELLHILTGHNGDGRSD